MDLKMAEYKGYYISNDGHFCGVYKSNKKDITTLLVYWLWSIDKAKNYIDDMIKWGLM